MVVTTRKIARIRNSTMLCIGVSVVKDNGVLSSFIKVEDKITNHTKASFSGSISKKSSNVTSFRVEMQASPLPALLTDL